MSMWISVFHVAQNKQPIMSVQPLLMKRVITLHGEKWSHVKISHGKTTSSLKGMKKILIMVHGLSLKISATTSAARNMTRHATSGETAGGYPMNRNAMN